VSTKKAAHCPHCSASVRAPLEAAGRTAPCPACKRTFTVQFAPDEDVLELPDAEPAPLAPAPAVPPRPTIVAATRDLKPAAPAAILRVGPPNGVAAGIEATYLGGHHALLDEADGRLSLGMDGIVFAAADGRRLDLPFRLVAEVTFPELGTHRREAVDRSEKVARASKVVETASKAVGLVGRFGSRFGLGGSSEDAADAAVAAEVAAGAGGLAAGVVGDAARLGPPPRNRLRVVMVEDGQTYHLYFDARGESATDSDAAAGFWRQSAAFRRRFLRPSAAPADG
jgi:hypothetical protein